MMKSVKKRYNLTTYELLVLLSLKGADNIYGLFDNVNPNPSKNKVNQVLFAMNKKGIIYEDDDRIKLNSDIENIIDRIIDAERILIVCASEETIYNQSIYLKNEPICIKFDGKEPDRVHVEMTSVSEIADDILLSGWGIRNTLPSMVNDEGRCPELIDEYEMYLSMDSSEWKKADEVRSVAKLVELSSKETIASMAIIDKGLDEYIVYKKDETVVYRYKDDTLKKLLINMMEG